MLANLIDEKTCSPLIPKWQQLWANFRSSLIAGNVRSKQKLKSAGLIQHIGHHWANSVLANMSGSASLKRIII